MIVYVTFTMKVLSFIITLLVFTLFVTANFGYNDPDGAILTPTLETFDNDSAFVNESANWVTPSLGVLADVNSTQFNAILQVLNIDESWLYSLNNSMWSKFGTTITTTVSGDDITTTGEMSAGGFFDSSIPNNYLVFVDGATQQYTGDGNLLWSGTTLSVNGKGAFSDGSRNAELTDGTYAGHFWDSSLDVKMADGSTPFAMRVEDGTNTVTIGKLSLALDILGDTESNGDIKALTLSSDSIRDNGGTLKIDLDDPDDIDFKLNNLITEGNLNADLGTFNNLDVDTLNLNGNVISDSTGTISFSNDNTATTGSGAYGTTIDANARLNVVLSTNSLSGAKYGIRSSLYANPASTSSVTYRAMEFLTDITSLNTADLTGTLYGIDGKSSFRGQGTATSLIGVRALALNGGVGTTTTVVGLNTVSGNSHASGSVVTSITHLISPPFATGSITNQYGMLINNQGHANIGTSAGIIMNDQTGSGTNIGGWIQSDTVGWNFGATLTDLFIHSDGTNGVIEVDDTLIVKGHLNVTKNFTGNQIYGEMWFHNDSNLFVVPLTEDVWANITAFENGTNGGELNGFSNSDYTLVSQIAGLYKVNYAVSASGGVNDKYHFSVALNNILQLNTESHRKISSGSDIGSASGSGFVRLEVGDFINMQSMNEDASADINIASININMVRIGD